MKIAKQRQSYNNQVGNKSDLANKRIVDIEEAKMFAERRELLLIETSALLAENIDNAFELLVKSRSYEELFTYSCL